MRSILSGLLLVAFVCSGSMTLCADGNTLARFETAINAGQELITVWNALTPSERETVIENARFEALHSGKTDVLSELQALRATRAPGALNSSNMLGIPLRVGTLELKALFKKMKGAIIVCTQTRFEATLDTYRMVVVPHPTNPKKVLSSFSGDDPQVPQLPIGAVITTNGTTAKIFGDDGTTVEVTHNGGVSYTFASNKLPVKVSAKYID